MSEIKSILMVAAENDALPSAKVGGIGDVVRDIPQALAQEQCEIKIVLPDYGHLGIGSTAECVDYFSVMFQGGRERVALYKVKPRDCVAEHDNISYWVISHPDFAPCGEGNIYCHDDASRPFATDATKYAFFCAAVAQTLTHGGFGSIDLLHLHDWHSAFMAILREYDTRYSALKSIKTVFTIHNLSLQGIRPFADDPSSLETWFPHLVYNKFAICDPRFIHCVNPMRAGIELADRVHAVSPSYAQEIQAPSRADMGAYGGEGLELSLQKAFREGRLHGIINGCDYPSSLATKKLSKAAYIEQCRSTLTQWACQSRSLSTFHWMAEKKLIAWENRKDRGLIVTSVGRMTDQKVRLLIQTVSTEKGDILVLDQLLHRLKNIGSLIILGSGQAEYEDILLKVASRHDNCIFLCGYSESLAQAIYATGDLFLMPSSFEPCGISQMLAMRAGQPCLVHDVGGLKDTIDNNVTGFSFNGDTPQQQASNLLKRFDEVLKLYLDDKKIFKAVAKAAKEQRFSWQQSALEYIEKLYS